MKSFDSAEQNNIQRYSYTNWARFKTNDKKKLSIVFILEDNLMSEGQGNNLHVHKSRWT